MDKKRKAVKHWPCLSCHPFLAKQALLLGQAGSNPEEANIANAKIQAALLRKASTVISSMVKEGKLKVVAGHYDVTTGVASLLS
jgi:carbonic anhydrase